MIVRKSAAILIRLGLLCAGLVVLVGCRMGVPIHTWKPPKLESTVGKQVIVADVVGPTELAEDLQQRLIDDAPGDIGCETKLIGAQSLEDKSQIKLAAASDGETSDVVLASVARDEGYQYVLRGELLKDRRLTKPTDELQKLTLSWRLFDLGDQRHCGGAPVVVDTKSALQRYPDLTLLSDDDEILKAAAVRETYGLITPSIHKDRVQLAIPYLLPGSKKVRRGNIAAIKGQWQEAQAIWRQAFQKHPAQVAAIHNLAIAAAAAQDFSQAKELARKAIRKQPTPLHKETLVWIELRQREYHRAFNLPDPPEGWFVTNAKE